METSLPLQLREELVEGDRCGPVIPVVNECLCLVPEHLAPQVEVVVADQLECLVVEADRFTLRPPVERLGCRSQEVLDRAAVVACLPPVVGQERSPFFGLLAGGGLEEGATRPWSVRRCARGRRA